MKTFGVVARAKAPEGYRGFWINIYKYGKRFQSGGIYKNRSCADLIAKKHRFSCIYVHIKEK